ELSRILPLDVRVYGTRRIGEYVYGIGEQIARFLYVWIIPVYIVLAVSSYISSMSLISGSAYELSIIKDLGAGRATVSLSILVYVALTSIIGSMLGLSIGLAGVQVASRIIGWIHPSISLTPILNVYDALIVFILSVTVSILGSMPHILGWVRMGSMGGYV
ncbi:MAG: FtsX-like permease family protein, partial [Candidatus Bathyarchaeia archaeon]